MFNKFSKVLALATSLLLSMQVQATSIALDTALTWGFNITGGGTTSGMILEVDELKFSANNYTDGTIATGSYNNYGYLTVDNYALAGSTVNTAAIVNDALAAYLADPGNVALLTELNALSSQFSDYALWATYTDWTGTVNLLDNTVSLDPGGTMTWYVTNTDTNVTTQVLLAEVESGVGYAPSGVINGSLTVVLDVISVTPGYFFLDEDEDGFDAIDDLSLSDVSILFGIANSDNTLETGTTSQELLDILVANNIFTYDDYDEISEFTTSQIETATQQLVDEGTILDANSLDAADEAALLAKLIEDYQQDNIEADLSAEAFDFFTSTDGSFQMAYPVPEPGMLGLMALALFGVAGFQYRRREDS